VCVGSQAPSPAPCRHPVPQEQRPATTTRPRPFSRDVFFAVPCARNAGPTSYLHRALAPRSPVPTHASQATLLVGLSAHNGPLSCFASLVRARHVIYVFIYFTELMESSCQVPLTRRCEGRSEMAVAHDNTSISKAMGFPDGRKRSEAQDCTSYLPLFF
jgi:hypothetical protein